MRKALIVLIILSGVFLAIGCTGNKPETTTEKTNVTETIGMKEFTLEELEKYNGSNGTAYVAYQGKVYNISGSNLWINGTHKKTHYAGKDLTEELDNDAPHGPEVFKDYPVVGTLKK